MNVSGVLRGIMTKHLDNEDFLFHVATIIEQQLKEWDERYEVYLMKMRNYELVVKQDEHYYHVYLSEQELQTLQQSGPFALDRNIWFELKNQELPIIRGVGNYIDNVFR